MKKDRYKRIPVAIAALLEQGEQEHVEFKSQIPSGGLSKHIAAGANLVALRDEIDSFTILLGVAESTDGQAAKGAVVGLSDKDGTPLTTDAARQTIANQAKDTIAPRVSLNIVEFNTGTDKPALHITVKPLNPPHHRGGKYEVRNDSTTAALTPDQIRAIISKQRLGELLTDFEPSGPLASQLAHIVEVGVAMALPETSDVDARLTYLSEDMRELNARVESLAAAQEADATILNDGLGDLKGEIEMVYGVVGPDGNAQDVRDIVDLIASQEMSAETAWSECVHRRQYARDLLENMPTAPEDAVLRTAILDVLDQHLGSSPPSTPIAYPANRAEVHGWNHTERHQEQDGSPGRLGHRVCRAVISRHYQQGIAVEYSRPDARTADEWLPTSDRSRFGATQTETAVLRVEDAPRSWSVIRSHGEPAESANRRTLTWRTQQGNVVAVLPNAGDTIVIACLGQWSTGDLDARTLLTDIAADLPPDTETHILALADQRGCIDALVQ